MSESVSQQDIEDLIAREPVYQRIQAAIDIQADIASNNTVRAIIAGFENDAAEAFNELAEVSPADTESVSRLLVRVRTIVRMRAILHAIVQRGEIARQNLERADY